MGARPLGQHTHQPGPVNESASALSAAVLADIAMLLSLDPLFSVLKWCSNHKGEQN